MPSYSFREAAILADVDQSTIYRLTKSGTLRYFEDAKGAKRVELDDLIKIYPECKEKLSKSVEAEIVDSKELQSTQSNPYPFYEVVINALQSQIDTLQRMVESKDEELKRAIRRERWMERQLAKK